MADDIKGGGNKFINRSNIVPGATAAIGTGAMISGFRGKKVSDPETGEVRREGISKSKVFIGGVMAIAGFLMLANKSGKKIPGLEKISGMMPGQNR